LKPEGLTVMDTSGLRQRSWKHGIAGVAYHHTDADLQQLKKWAENKPTYLFFNNNWMKEDALRLLGMIRDRDGP